MKDLIRQLEAERDAALATWKARPAESDSSNQSPSVPGASTKAGWLDRLRTWIASQQPQR